MNANDPFGDYIDDDKTILRPNPGGRRAKPAEPEPLSPLGTSGGIPEPLREQIAQTSGNPLTGCAVALLSLASQLRNSVSHSNVAGLRNSVINEIKQFEIKLRNHGVPPEQIQAARYALCTSIDEAVLNTPWGGNGLWATQGLLITFHKEAWGGEKFFLILKNSMQQPATHLHLLELLYFCLCLGFEGKYRVQDHGATKLEEVRENLYQLIQRQRGDSERELSIHWQGIRDERNLLAKLVPLWVIATVSSLALMFIFLGFLYAINNAANPLLGKLYGIKDSVSAPFVVQKIESLPTPSESTVKWKGFMAPEVERGEVSVDESNGKTIVRILSSGLFASGSDKFVERYRPLLDKISSELALTKIADRIVVAGHTDNVPIFSARFPSNYDLSMARARTVVELLSRNPQLNTAIVAEGRADSQPLVENDTAEHKAINRRVEIIF